MQDVYKRQLYALVVLTMGLYLALDGAYQPAALNSKSVKFVAAEIEKIAPESEGTDVYKRQVYCLPVFAIKSAPFRYPH